MGDRRLTDVRGGGRAATLRAVALAGFFLALLPAGCGRKAAPFLSRPVEAAALEVAGVTVKEGTVSVRFEVPGETFRMGKEERPWTLVRLLRRRLEGDDSSYVERAVIRDVEGFAFGGSRTIEDVGVGAGRYLYRVELRKEEGVALAETDPIPIDRTSLPAITGDIEIEGREGAISLSWAAPADGPRGLLYNVYRRGRDESGPISREPLTVTNFTDTRIAREAEYCYHVETVLLKGGVRVEGGRSREVCGRSVDRTPPPAPAGVRLVHLEGAFRLSWLPVESGDPAGYNVYRSSGGGPFVKINADPVAGTGYRDSDLEGGVEYVYRLTAVDSSSRANESTFSDPVKGEVPAR
jgi:hypothetical protein